MNVAEAAHFFDAIAGRYDRVYALESDESRKRMIRVLRELPSSPAQVLDLGVGTGRELSALLDAGHVPTGVDVSMRMLERCARRARKVALVHADLWRLLPFADASFDAAVALHGTLAHPPDDEALARLGKELARVLGPGGVWVSEVPSLGWLEQLDAPAEAGERNVRRTGPQTCVYEDHVVGVSVEARFLTEMQWRAGLSPHWTLRVELLSEVEWLIVARRT
jgi:ubiquinone/menaquinone biosynthesis C-methylase UbiE